MLKLVQPQNSIELKVDKGSLFVNGTQVPDGLLFIWDYLLSQEGDMKLPCPSRKARFLAERDGALKARDLFLLED